MATEMTFVHIFAAIATVLGTLAITTGVLWLFLSLLMGFTDSLLDAFGVRSEVCFYIKNRQSIRAAIGRDPKLKERWERWREQWDKWKLK